VVVYFQQLNKWLADVDCVLPTAEEILARIDGSREFSIIDLAKSYHQLQVDEHTSRLLGVKSRSGKYAFRILLLHPWRNSIHEFETSWSL